MHWFKIVLLVIFGAGILIDIAKSGGYKEKERTPQDYSIEAVIHTLLFLGIWFLL